MEAVVRLTTNDLLEGFRQAGVIRYYAQQIHTLAQKLTEPLRIMEVCGGHTHTIMKYGLPQLMPEAIRFIHGPGCPVCIMPKERIDHAITLARQPDVILVTLGDMIKVPGSMVSLQKIRAEGADVRFVYSPLDALKIATDHPQKRVIYFAIGFETTTPMTAALIQRALSAGIDNLLVHVNHVVVLEPMMAIMDEGDALIDAFIGPSHVSVIAGSKIYEPIAARYQTPVVVSGFEPVDLLQGVEMILRQKLEGRAEVEIQYTRSVTREGNVKAQEMIDTFFERAESFRWRGIGDIPHSSLRLKEAYAFLDAERIYGEILPAQSIDDHKLCRCGEILKGKVGPLECPLFGRACTPANPIGSCMVSSEGACAAYYKYAR
ncbi:MAG: hydrogenase formation protein HypD [Campylobacterales bacterium]